MNIEINGLSNCSHFGGIKNIYAMNNLVHVFGVHRYAFLLGVFLGEEWLDYRACVCPVLQIMSNVFLKYSY